MSISHALHSQVAPVVENSEIATVRAFIARLDIDAPFSFDDLVGPFTSDSLLVLAIELEKLSRGRFHYPIEQAMLCAEWMEAKGVGSLRFVGPFGGVSRFFKAGVVVEIAKGTPLRSTNPRKRAGDVAGRTYTVSVHDSNNGWAERDRRAGDDWHGVQGHRDVNVRQPVVIWVGAGSYFYEADPNALVIRQVAG